MPTPPTGRRKKKELTHLTESGAARMVDVSQKKVTRRRAAATAEVRMSSGVLSMIVEGRVAKGDVLAAARIAGIQAAKQTSALIPLCHPLPIDAVSIELTPAPPDRVTIRCQGAVRARTGVEMEALTGASVAALTVYDMCKSADRGMVIGPIQLESKSGGRSGVWKRKG